MTYKMEEISIQKGKILNNNVIEIKYNEPWKHIVIDNLFDDNLMKNACASIPDYNSTYWNSAKKYINEYTSKWEMTNIMLFPDPIREITNYLISSEFVNKLEKMTGINELIIDEKIYGGGLIISPEGAFLEKHIDFNYNNDIGLFRSVNLILYFNELNGGEFQLYDEKLNEIKVIKPNINRMLIFASNNKTIHGFNKIISESRKSLNLWYYTKNNQEYVDHEPHKTIWYS